MKPFTTEGDVWRFLAGEFENEHRTRYSKTGLCDALAYLSSDDRISDSLYISMNRRLRHKLSPTHEDVLKYSAFAYWWPLYDRKTGRAERALACAFLAVLADEEETFNV